MTQAEIARRIEQELQTNLDQMFDDVVCWGESFSEAKAQVLSAIEDDVEWDITYDAGEELGIIEADEVAIYLETYFAIEEMTQAELGCMALDRIKP